MKITDFKLGDKITRTEPIMVSSKVMDENLRIEIPSQPKAEFHYVGVPVTFLSVANGCFNGEVFGRVVVFTLSKESEIDWFDGWEYFEEWPTLPKLEQENQPHPFSNMIQGNFHVHELESEPIPEMPMYQGILITACIFFTAHSALNFLTKKLFK